MLGYNFKPIINNYIPDFTNQEPIVVKGLSKHVEKMENARLAKREREEFENEAFIRGDNWGKNGYITKPKPFNLSYYNSKKHKGSYEIENTYNVGKMYINIKLEKIKMYYIN